MSIKQIYFYFAILVLTVSLANCAKVASPRGGNKDKTPPKMDSLHSETFARRNYNPKLLEFTFDEYVEVKNPSKEVFISPALVYRPQVISRGKKVQVIFDKRETLKPNTTYNINFGNAVVDFHEGNVLKNFEYYFSTGANIDSLALDGRVINALTNEPEKDMLVGLFGTTSDSVVFNDKPIYVTRLDSAGKFNFRYISSASYRLVALDDKNLNFKYDPVNEKIGFVNDAINLSDSTESFTLYSSLAKPSSKIIGKQLNTYGQAYFQYNSLPDSVAVASIPDISLQFDTNKDTLFVMYQTDLDSFKMVVNKDTFQIKIRNKEKWAEKYKFSPYNIKEPTLLVKDTYYLKMSAPFTIIDTSKIVLFDSVRYIRNVNIQQSGRVLSLVYPWSAGIKYNVVIDSAAFRDIHGNANDSIKQAFLTLTSKDLCNYNITVKDLDVDSNYVINVLKRDNSILATLYIANDSIGKITLKQIRPDGYDFEIFEDRNNNKVWDPGDFLLKRQPEPYKLFRGEQLKPDRDFDKVISWDNSPVEIKDANTLLKGK